MKYEEMNSIYLLTYTKEKIKSLNYTISANEKNFSKNINNLSTKKFEVKKNKLKEERKNTEEYYRKLLETQKEYEKMLKNKELNEDEKQIIRKNLEQLKFDIKTIYGLINAYKEAINCISDKIIKIRRKVLLAQEYRGFNLKAFDNAIFIVPSFKHTDICLKGIKL